MIFRLVRGPLLLPALLAGCTAIPQASGPALPPPPPQSADARPVPPQAPPPPPVEGFRAPAIQALPGLEWLLRQDARAIAGQLGPPRLELTEGDMRKLQFSGAACVLDVFLYPLHPGGAPVATHMEARRASDGQEVDRRACAESLRAR